LPAARDQEANVTAINEKSADPEVVVHRASETISDEEAFGKPKLNEDRLKNQKEKSKPLQRTQVQRRAETEVSHKKPLGEPVQAEPPGADELKDRLFKALPGLLGAVGQDGTLDYQVFWQRFISWLDQQKDVPEKVRGEFRKAFAVELGLRVE